MDIAGQIAKELSVAPWQVEAVVRLLDEGNTIPFIARYRKEMHGAMNDEQLRKLEERLGYLRNLEGKKAQAISSIEEQGKLTDALRERILSAATQVEVDDLYRPYRPKRRTRASIAREKGLGGLSEAILAQEPGVSMEREALGFVSPEKGVESAEEAIEGAKDILAEDISDNAEYRAYIREATMREGTVVSAARDEKAQSVYETYYKFEEPVGKIAGYRVLALNRGEKEKFLTVKVTAPEERILRYLEKKTVTGANEEAAGILREAIQDSYRRLIAPAIEREVRASLTERAEDGAIRVFGKNLEQLLMQPPIPNQVVLGWDPAFRTGCKLAVVDATGKVLETAVVYPTEPQNKVEEAKRVVKGLIERHGVTLISLGNGTASRESEKVIAEIIREVPRPVHYAIVSEAGASVYSASKLATEEFPNFDVGQRSAASIARRLQDPLSELVKMEPKSIGVGQYQHDMNQKKLDEALSGVVEDSVNRVGVDLNTASAPLLEHVSGITKPIARSIVAYREENGRFTNRRQLLKVARLGPKAYEQCAGFLRIDGGDNPLDATGVHPESYEAAKGLLDALGWTLDDVRRAKSGGVGMDEKAGKGERDGKAEKAGKGERAGRGERVGKSEKAGKEGGPWAPRLSDKEGLAAELGIGVMTLEDILAELEKPGRDPRDDMPRPILRTDVMEMKDLKEGMTLKGTVRNVMDFGAFVDIGVHQDGLVHVSQMSDKGFVRHPLDVVSVGDVVEVRVLGVDLQKKRIQLTMKRGKEDR